MPAISGSAALLTLCCFCSTMLSVTYPFLSQMMLRKKLINFGLNEDMLIIGQQFYLNPDNTFFHIHAIKASSDGFQFSIQYKNTREPVVADLDEVRWMLQNSSILTSCNMLITPYFVGLIELRSVYFKTWATCCQDVPNFWSLLF
ncbi:hypothetical protein BKA82DRAFT_4015823 [Pisolithus tinctorius]|nr:hypothetical protein BKA82DRAFT_4015823 [Pisolithus tinctorius]